jgi:hypothetical protein
MYWWETRQIQRKISHKNFSSVTYSLSLLKQENQLLTCPYWRESCGWGKVDRYYGDRINKTGSNIRSGCEEEAGTADSLVSGLKIRSTVGRKIRV